MFSPSLSRNSQFPINQDTMRYLTGLLFLVFSLQEIIAPDPVAVTKCCPDGQIYNSAEKRCVEGAGKLFTAYKYNAYYITAYYITAI